MSGKKFAKFFEITFLVFFLSLIIGTPLIFTSLTRSVFEVNKLLLLRIVLVLVSATWILKYFLFKDNNVKKEGKAVSILGFKWRLTGLEIPIFLWVIINILSTIFSQNIKISIIGAYDRWEGIITVLNYVMLIFMISKLVTKRYQLFWIIGALITPTAISSIYGVIQSLGYDFMHWSVDPTFRVFACINNPVHFCAYVSMIVPIGISTLLFLSNKSEEKQNHKKELLKWLIFFSIVIIYYAQFLSFSRATWLGFIGSMSLFYLMATNSLRIKKQFSLISDFIFSGVFIGAIYIVFIFRLYLSGPIVYIPAGLIICAYLFYLYIISFEGKRLDKQFSPKNILTFLLINCVLLLALVIDLIALNSIVYISAYILLIASILILAFTLENNLKFYAGRLILFIIFAKLQFIAISVPSIFLYFCLVYSYYRLQLKSNVNIVYERKFWLYLFLIVFGIIIIVPSFSNQVSSFFTSDPRSSLNALKNVEHRVKSYKNDALEGTARTSMWKSSLPWIKDYWILGTGPDTIKYMYPKYRRPEYGALEGGHNFTPDRLHNEYLNTLATRGVLGFLAYYFGIIFCWLVIAIKSYYKLRNSKYKYLLIGFITSVIIYLGQVLFNFGVVATMVLFHICFGLSLAIAINKDFHIITKKVDTNDG
jgi:hypothetical protein